ncbi:MAG: BatA domain-containing protein [Planctomycetota bacterium]
MLDFLNPGLLIGAALFAVPLVIHLLNRQRFRRRPWAAMEFLLAAYKKQRRRLRRENLLLLLLRCLIPIVLALAIARPLLRDSALAAHLGSGNAHHVLVLDATGSMGLELRGATTPFERAKALATALLDRIASQESTPHVSVIVQGLHAAMPVRDELDLQRAKARIAALEPPVDGGSELRDALVLAARAVDESSEPEVRVHVFTDLQARAFGNDAEKSAAEARPPEPGKAPTAEDFRDNFGELLTHIREKAEINLFDVRAVDGGTEDNLQVSDLRLGTVHAIRRVPLPVIATVRNRTGEKRSAQVTLEIDGGQPSRRSVQVEAGAETEAEFEITLTEAGAHRLRASIESDGFTMDDQRFLAVDVRERIDVLVVEGSSETDPALRTSTLLVEVLDPTEGKGSADLTPFRPTVVDPIALLTGRVRPGDFDLVVLADVDRLNTQSGDALTEAVRAGTGLFVMFGARAEPDSYVANLQRGGYGPLPMVIGSPRGYDPRADQWFNIGIAAPDHPVLREFREDAYRQLLGVVPVWRFVGAERPAEEEEPAPAKDPAADASTRKTSGQVLLEVRDPSRSPLLVAARFGAGRALFLTSPISRDPGRWNRLDSPVGGLPFLLIWPMAEWLTAPRLANRNVTVGDALSTSLPSRPRDIAVLMPERAGVAKLPIGEDPVPLPGGRYALPPFRRTDYAGFYEFEMQLGEQDVRGRHTELFAVEPDAAEGDLTYLGHAKVRDRFGFAEVLTELPSTSNTAVDSGVRELGPQFLWATLLFLIGEAAFARFIARRRA